MCIDINSINRNVCNAIKYVPFEITMTNEDDVVVVPKPEALWNGDDEKRYACNWKARNIIIYTLGFAMRVQMRSNKLESIV